MSAGTTKFRVARNIRNIALASAGCKLLVALFAIFTVHSALFGQKANELVFSDEFAGAHGTPPDPNKWTLEVGGGGWGNKELEYYRNSSENAFLDGSGDLSIQAAKLFSPQGFVCWYGPCKYTSARLITKGKFDRLYGRFEAADKDAGRARRLARILAAWRQYRQGRLAAMRRDRHHGKHRARAARRSRHGAWSWLLRRKWNQGLPFTLSKGVFSDDFHVFSVDWSPDQIRWFVDGTLYRSLSPNDLPSGSQWVFDHPFFMILNFAVGGGWPGNPDPNTLFPQSMLVDYVRVYANNS